MLDNCCVVPFDPEKDRLLQMDFTDANQALTIPVVQDIQEFTKWVSSELERSGCRYGVGGYAEHRTVYSRSPVFDDPDGREPRRLHLGLDIWGPEGTSVSAILDGEVHSYGYNNQLGDYGATIILKHQWEGLPLYSLYGHVSLRDLKGMAEGQLVKKGEVIAHFGGIDENGYWPPHLHLQLIHDIEGWKGDYPGVCRFSEKDLWLRNCPDPWPFTGWPMLA
jgi:murein DD-endopeptidase MepM/ murein hydrolase activator NlpD